MIFDIEKFGVLREIAELSTDGVVIYSSRDSRVVYVNEIASESFSIKDDESGTLEHVLLQGIHDDDRAYAAQALRKMGADCRTIEISYRTAGLNGIWQYVCCQLYSVCQDRYLVAMLRDMTKEKTSEAYLIEFGSKKNMLLHSLGHNLSGALGIAHQMATEAIKPSQLNDPAKTHRYLELLNENSLFCIEVIKDLLSDEFAKASQVASKPERFDVAEKIWYIVEELRASYPGKTFVIENRSVSSFAKSDQVKMLQVLVNLLSNAVKFTGDGGEIRVIIEDAGELIRISVADNGIGIPKSLQPFVFDPRGGAQRPGVHGEMSFGLGLSINKQMVAMMGGQIWMESVEHQGSTFIFTIPT